MSYLDKYISLTNFKFNTTNEDKDVLIQDEIESFELYLSEAPNYYSINKHNRLEKIDCTIQDASFNNKTVGDEKILCVRYNENLSVGDIVDWNSRQWTIITEEDNSIKSHKTFIVRPCNNTLKFILPSDHKKIIEIPCITSNMSLYSIGLEEQKQVITSDGKKFCIVPFDDYTNEIFIKQRFLFWDKQGFEVTEISSDKASISNDVKQGILEIKMQQVETIPEDDMESSLAYNKNISLESPLPEKTIIINGDYKLFLGKTREYTVTYEDGTPITDKTFTFSFADTSLATIQSYTNTSVVLLANSSKKGYGDLVVYDEFNNVITSKSIWVRSLI